MFVKKLFALSILIVMLLLPFKASIASPIIQDVLTQSIDPVNQSLPSDATSTGTAPDNDLTGSGIGSLAGSNVIFDPTAGGDTCYVPGTTQTLCFKSESYTTDYEYVYNNWIKFPTDWAVSNVYVQGTPVCDNGGSWGTFGWSFQTSPYEVNIAHARYQLTTDHCVATYCFEVTPAGTSNPAQMSWFFDGDGYGSIPHNPCSNDGYTPADQNACDEMVNPLAAVSLCSVTPEVILTPAEIVTSGCHGVSQFHILTIENQTGGTATFNITYEKNFTGEIYGPEQITLADGATTNFDVVLEPHTCAEDGDYIATITASDGTYSDQSTIQYAIFSELNEWQQITSNPVPLMDNVVAAHNDKVWSITGYGATADVSYYDPILDTWTVVPSSAPPFGINYARSGCQVGNEVFVYGDAATAGFTGLWSYNMDSNTWTAETPGGTPPPHAGIWSPSWVADSETGLCYMTGGATTPGGGNLATTFVYDAVANAWLTPLPNFTNTRDFHAAFLFVRPSDTHKLLCVAGGADPLTIGYISTQCYDFTTAAWNAENADLGALPATWWGMGYAQRPGQLWFVGGVNAAGALNNQTAYYDIDSGTWMLMGPLPSGAFYRTAAVNLNDTIYHVGGSTGSFYYSGLSDVLLDIPCPACVIPGFSKQATPEAMPGENIHYTITMDSLPSEVAFMLDPLPESVEYVPGSLVVDPDVGIYGYDPGTHTIYWSNGIVKQNIVGWSPAEKTGGLTSTAIITQGGQPDHLDQSSKPDHELTSVLWDQPLSTVNQAAYVNQEFPDYPTSSSFLADDFVADVPWMIDAIFVPGDGWNGFSTLLNATALTFMIYEDAGGVPAGDPSGGGAPPIWALTILPTDPHITITNGYSGYPSNTLLTLDSPMPIPAGHYWLIFYPTLNFTNFGQHGRQPADTTNGLTAQFINPGGAFGYGTVWQPWTILGPVQTDMAFRIEGTALTTLHIDFDATVKAFRQTIFNIAFLHYGDIIVDVSAPTFTGYGIYVPIIMK